MASKQEIYRDAEGLLVKMICSRDQMEKDSLRFYEMTIETLERFKRDFRVFVLSQEERDEIDKQREGV